MKPTNREIISRANIINSIPCALEGRNLPQSTMSALILLQVAYQRAANDFDKFVREAMEKAKPGYINTLTASEVPDTDDMTDEQRNAKAEAVKEKEEINRMFGELHNNHADAEADKDLGKLTSAQFADICGMIGASGTIVLPITYGIDAEGKEIKEWPRAAFLQFLASTLVSE